MQTWVLVSAFVAVTSYCFVDDHIVPSVDKGARFMLALSGIAFVVTESIALIF
ncbi:MAG TPA: hypothetical protein VEC60_19515 [Reyranella sp.]|nr:hypothetical protein [Reyranella sp.]